MGTTNLTLGETYRKLASALEHAGPNAHTLVFAIIIHPVPYHLARVQPNKLLLATRHLETKTSYIANKEFV